MPSGSTIKSLIIRFENPNLFDMQWYIAIHRAPLGSRTKATWCWGDIDVETWRLNGADLTAPLPVTFEQAIATMQSWNCMLIEPDGALVWANPAWRIDAQLQDGRDGLQYVEVRTTAPRHENEKLLTAFGHPDHNLVIQLIHEGIFLDAATWLDLQATGAPSSVRSSGM